MILRLSDSLSRARVVAAALAVATGLCFFGVRAATARYGFAREFAKYPETAVRLERGESARLVCAWPPPATSPATIGGAS